MGKRARLYAPLLALAVALVSLADAVHEPDPAVRLPEQAEAPQPPIPNYCLGLVQSKVPALLAALRARRPVMLLSELDALEALRASGAFVEMQYFSRFGGVRWASIAELIGLELGELERKRGRRAGLDLALMRRGPVVARIDDRHDAIVAPIYWRRELAGVLWVKGVRDRCPNGSPPGPLP